MTKIADLHNDVAAIDASDDYRVLSRVDHRDLERRETCDLRYRLGVVVDVETTGLDASRDRIIELAVRMFWTTTDGIIVAVGPSRSWLEDPGEPLSSEVIQLTGLTDADLASRRIDDIEVTAMLTRADFIVAHNAGFDRPFIERRFQNLRGFAWCCSCHDFDWRSHGFDGRGLGWLLAQCGQFHDGHRAAADVDASIALLRHVLPDGRTVLSKMLANAERPSWRVRAVGAHFDVRHDLRARGYRWNVTTGRASVWQREVQDDALADERAWLAQSVYRRDRRPSAFEPTVTSITWQTRYSD